MRSTDSVLSAQNVVNPLRPATDMIFEDAVAGSEVFNVGLEPWDMGHEKGDQCFSESWL